MQTFSANLASLESAQQKSISQKGKPSPSPKMKLKNRQEVGLHAGDSMHLLVVTKRGRGAHVVKRTKDTQRIAIK
jgi:hypothetical protein